VAQVKTEWLAAVEAFAGTPAEFYSGNRKILRNRTIKFSDLTPDIDLADIGFTKSKLSQLRRNYIHEESRAAAVTLWEARLKKDKYGSVGFHCFKHYVKGRSADTATTADGQVNIQQVSKRASVMGPCMQSFSITLMDDGTTAVDVFYRTTELFKKFPADVIFFPEMLAPFDFRMAPLTEVTCHFANVTCHPMYFASLLPLFEDPVGMIEAQKAYDPYFWKWIVKWTARYLCDEYAHGIAKFAQALRVKHDVRERLDPYAMEHLQWYLRENHPGYTHTRFEHPAPGEVVEDEEEGEE
jgi:hypothetical protein